VVVVAETLVIAAPIREGRVAQAVGAVAQITLILPVPVGLVPQVKVVPAALVLFWIRPTPAAVVAAPTMQVKLPRRRVEVLAVTEFLPLSRVLPRRAQVAGVVARASIKSAVLVAPVAVAPAGVLQQRMGLTVRQVQQTPVQVAVAPAMRILPVRAVPA